MATCVSDEIDGYMCLMRRWHRFILNFVQFPLDLLHWLLTDYLVNEMTVSCKGCLNGVLAHWLADSLVSWSAGSPTGWLVSLLACFLTDWLIRWLAGLVAHWLADSLVSWLAGSLTGWFAGLLACWLTDWLTRWLAGLLVHWLAASLVIRLTDWLPRWLGGMLAHWPADLLVSRLTDWLSRWLAGSLTDVPLVGGVPLDRIPTRSNALFPVDRTLCFRSIGNFFVDLVRLCCFRCSELFFDILGTKLGLILFPNAQH